MSDYIQATVIVDGALDEERTFTSKTEFDVWFSRIKCEDFTGMEVDIYTIVHNHPQSQEECVCVQYMNDHAPMWSNHD